MEPCSALSPVSSMALGGPIPSPRGHATQTGHQVLGARKGITSGQLAAGRKALYLIKQSHWLKRFTSMPLPLASSSFMAGQTMPGLVAGLPEYAKSNRKKGTTWHFASSRQLSRVCGSLRPQGSGPSASRSSSGQLASRGCANERQQSAAGRVSKITTCSAAYSFVQIEGSDDVAPVLADCHDRGSGNFEESEKDTQTPSARPLSDRGSTGVVPVELVRLASTLFAAAVVTAVVVVPAHAAVATAEADKKTAGVQVPPTAPSPAGVQGSGTGADAKSGAEVSAPAGKKAAEPSGKRTKKPPRVMDFAERREWVKDLPLVKEKIPYTDILKLRESNQLKAIVKHPYSKLQDNPETCLVVLADDHVVRTVLPAPERDERFWKTWSDLKIQDMVIDAYTPPPPLPQMEPWGNWGPSLSWLSQLTDKIMARKDKKAAPAKQATAAGKAPAGKPAKKLSAKEREELAVRERIQRLDRERKELEKARIARERRARVEREERSRKEREAKAKRMQEERKEEARIARLEKEQQRRERQESKWAADDVARQKAMVAAVQSQEQRSRFWAAAAQNESFRFLLGSLFFVMFYYGVVVNVKKRKQDYEDRVKLNKAADEERRKLQEWEDQMSILDDIAASDKDKALSEEAKLLEGKGEENKYIAISKKFLRSGAKVKLGQAARRKRPPQYLDVGEDVRFEDVAGLGEIRKELEEIVDFFNHSEKYRQRGSKIPSGILLCGEPGTGKTLLAKAVAGEAGVNFFSISASQFVEIYVGVGASRVRALYNEARENAPAVVFIDELDAVGRKRGSSSTSGGQERDATLNQLLTCLDGFEGKGDVITMAATNRVDILDSALIRPGRFDRKIFVPKPSTKGREQILKVHARRKPVADDVDFEQVAGMTDGMNGAQLANIVDVAALKVLREGRSEISTDDLLDAATMEAGGYPSQYVWTGEKRHQLALNEASYATVAAAFPMFSQIKMVSIVPRIGEVKGRMTYLVDICKLQIGGLSRTELLDFITMQLAPMLADQMWHGKDETSTIWADATDIARKTARRMALQGLSGRKEVCGVYETWQQMDRVKMLDQEARKILDSCEERCRKILERNRTLLDTLVEELLNKGALHGDEFWDLVKEHGDYDEHPPQLQEIRERHVAKFKERMLALNKS